MESWHYPGVSDHVQELDCHTDRGPWSARGGGPGTYLGGGGSSSVALDPRSQQQKQGGEQQVQEPWRAHGAEESGAGGVVESET